MNGLSITTYHTFHYDVSSYGWDWGPVLMTVGPWRTISLHSYESRITDVRVRTEVTKAFDVTILISVESDAIEGYVDITVNDSNKKSLRKEASLLKDGKTLVKFIGSKDEFDLWYPVGHGKQCLYTVEVRLSDGVRYVFTAV